MSSEGSVELSPLVGVIEDIKAPLNSRFFFPSKVGGRPAWMIPENIPAVSCDSCRNPMTFLLQLYAPDSENPQAFHRTLMVFCCLSCRCFLKCIRTQISLENKFYPTEMISLKEAPTSDPAIENQCCESCGSLSHIGSVCRSLPEYGLSIEEIDEIDMRDDEDDDDDDEDMVHEENEKAGQICAKSEMTIDESEEDLFNEFTETSIDHDASFRIFKKFVTEVPTDHVIYYSIGGTPIWITDQNQMPGPAPACEHCKGPRQFEFQIQPQLIYHLMKRLRGFPMNAAPFEWGVVAIYTCKANCSGGVTYREEFVYNQLEPAEWLEFDARKKVDFNQDKSANSNSAPKVVVENSDDDGEWM